jgi:hypothetical protein
MVKFEARVAGGTVDGFDQPDTFAAPVTVEGCAVAPGAPADEALGPTRVNANEVTCTVYIRAGRIPAGFAVHLGDRATVPGLGALRAVDDGADWGAGLVVLLGRFDG